MVEGQAVALCALNQDLFPFIQAAIYFLTDIGQVFRQFGVNIHRILSEHPIVTPQYPSRLSGANPTEGRTEPFLQPKSPLFLAVFFFDYETIPVDSDSVGGQG